MLSTLEKLEAACEEKEELQQVKQFGDEYEEFNDKIDREMSNIRTCALKNVEEIGTPEVSEGGSAPSEGSGLKSDTHRQLERIRIPVFNGNKLKFQQWLQRFQAALTKHRWIHILKCCDRKVVWKGKQRKR